MKNRDIEKDEINKITEKCRQLREKAFFTIMRQSGLPPHAIKQLQIKHVERILEPNTPIPCKIKRGKFRNIPDFIGGEAVKYLQQYLATRTNLTPESLLFTIRNNPNKEINTKNVSRAFRQAAQKLEITKKITYEVKERKPSELRLYSLIKFYRKNAKYYLAELDNNAPRDDEFYRKLYEEKAMPFLEIEPPTPLEIHQLKKQQQKEIRKLETKNKELTERLARIEESMLPVTRLYHEILGTVPQEMFPELKKYTPTEIEEKREQIIQKALNKIREEIEKEQRTQTTQK